MRLIVLACITYLLFLFVSIGCRETKEPPKDWPKLKVIIMQNVPDLVRASCPGLFVIGCTVPDFKRGNCHVMTSTSDPIDLQIELSHRHCEGYDHAGDAAMTESWNKYKAVK